MSFVLFIATHMVSVAMRKAWKIEAKRGQQTESDAERKKKVFNLIFHWLYFQIELCDEESREN